MKIKFAFPALALLLLASCSGNQQKLEEDSARIAALSEQYNQATDFNDSLLLLMGDIYTGLDSINIQEGLLYNMNQGDNADRRAEIRENLANIKARLNANRALLAKMESDLKKSNNENSIQAKTIAALKTRIEQQDQKLAQLEEELANARGQIESLNTKVAETQEQVKSEAAAKEQAQQQAREAENEANRVFYAIGNNKTLKANGLISKKFLGATKVMKGDFNASYFVMADKRRISSIPTNSKKVKILSNMPNGSYEIVENADKTKTIKITDPSLFWSVTPYLVVETD